MEALLKALGLLLFTVLIRLLLSKREPELSLLLGLAAVSLVLLTALRSAASLRALVENARQLLGERGELTTPLLKCVGAALVSRLGADFCRDASHSAEAAALEWMGTVCALGIAAPLLLSVMNSLGGLL